MKNERREKNTKYKIKTHYKLNNDIRQLSSAQRINHNLNVLSAKSLLNENDPDRTKVSSSNE